MNTSILLARIFGPYCVIVALSFLLKRQNYADVVEDFLKSVIFKIFGGAIALLLGLLIVNVHNIWKPGWEVLVTIFGWISLLKGVTYFIFPKYLEETARKYAQNTSLLRVQLGITLAIGLFLTYKGYGCCAVN